MSFAIRTHRFPLRPLCRPRRAGLINPSVTAAQDFAIAQRGDLAGFSGAGARPGADRANHPFALCLLRGAFAEVAPMSVWRAVFGHPHGGERLRLWFPKIQVEGYLPIGMGRRFRSFAHPT